MRRIAIYAGIPLGILILTGIAVWTFANPNRHRAFIQSQLEDQLGRKVTLGEMSLGLFPFRFQVKNAAIAEDPSMEQQEPFIQADELDIRISLSSLLRGDVQLDSVELRRPRVELVRNKEGAWNFSTLGRKGEAGSPDSGSSGESAPPEFVLEQLAVVDGQLGITDLQSARPRAGYDHINLTLLHFAAGKPFSFDLAVRIQGEGSQEIRLNGEAGPVSVSSPADTPFRGTLSLTQVGIEGLMKFLDSEVITKARGNLSGQGEILNQPGELKTNGKIQLDGAQVNGLDIGYPIALDYDLSASAVGIVTINKAAMQLGSTPLAFTGTLNTGVTPPSMDVGIKLGGVAITELARLASAFGLAFAPGASVTGRLSADMRARGSAAKPEWTGTIGGRELRISGQGIALPVEVKAMDLLLTPRAIQSNEFTATSGKTAVIARFSLLEYASNSPSVDLALKSPGATLPDIQSITKAYGITGLDQLSGEGSLNFDLNAKGALQSLSTAAAVRNLNGTINVDFSPLRIAGFDTAHELGKLGGFVSAIAQQSETEIVRMAGRILVKNGVAQTDDLRMQLGIGSLSTSGTADLESEALNLKLSAVFSKEFTDKIGSTRTGTFMNAALTNSAGELVLPAIVTGTFHQPRFSPDLKAAAELQKQKYLPSLKDPAAAVGTIIETLTGKGKAATGQPEGEKPSAIQRLLGVFGGKKDEEPAK